MVTAVATLSAGDIELLLLWAVFVAFLVYRSSERYRLMAGAPPWRVPSWVWMVLVFVVPGLALLYLYARFAGRPPAGPRRGWHGGAAMGPTAGHAPGEAASGRGSVVPHRPPTAPTGHEPPGWVTGGRPAPSTPPGLPPAGLGPPDGRRAAGPPYEQVATDWDRVPSAVPTDPSGLPFPPHWSEGWYVDPTERNFLRFWDGQRWTDRVATGGRQSTDPPVP